jgi:hypothetical protein
VNPAAPQNDSGQEKDLDLVVLELGTLNDRDRIFDAYFDYAKTLFVFSVLFLVRDGSAHGRNVHGLGAPQGLVSRLTIKPGTAGILSRAHASRDPFVVPGPAEEADLELFGYLGRALPAPVVVPLTVRSRVVGVFIGETASERLSMRAAKARRRPMDVAIEELSILSEASSAMLERLILRRKRTGDTFPPPPDPRGSAPPPSFAAPRLPSLGGPRVDANVMMPMATAVDEVDRRTRRRRKIMAPTAAVSGILLVGVAAWFLTRVPTARDGIVTPGSVLRGWPSAVDPADVLETALAASGLGPSAQLTVLEAEVGTSGKVDFRAAPANAGSIYLRVEFATEDRQAGVLLDASGIRAPRQQPRERCGQGPCRHVVPRPACATARVIAAARDVGLEENQRPFLRYAGARDTEAPEWSVAVPGRGAVRLDGVSCRPLARERLRPAALPIEKVPGAPGAVDPVAIVTLARTQSGFDPDAMLLEIDARGVMEGGLVDLQGEGRSIVYTFAEPPGRKQRRWRQVSVTRQGIPTTNDDGDYSPLPVRFQGAALETPRCTFADAWYYLTRKVPAVDAARMTYGPDLASDHAGMWSLELGSLASRRTVADVECEAWAKLNAKKK